MKTNIRNTAFFLAFSMLIMILIANLLPHSDDSSMPKDMNNLSDIAYDINLSNKYVFDIIGEGLDNEELPLRVSSSIDDLLSSKSDLADLSSESKYESIRQNMSIGLDYNILFYRQLSSILNNLNASDIAESEKNLKKYDEAASDAYGKTSPLKFYYFDNENSSMNSLYSSLGNLTSSNRNTQISLLKNKEFLTSLEKIITDFDSLNKDFSPYVEKYNDKSLSYDSLMDELDKSQTKLDALVQNIYALSVPSEASVPYESFKNVLSAYRAYLTNFQLDFSKYAVSSNDEAFSNSFSKKDDADSAYERFKADLETYKADLNLGK